MASDNEKAATTAVETLIWYKFTKPALLWEALNVMPTIVDGVTRPTGGHKRLAIIGDAVLRLALAEDWYKSDTSIGDFQSKHATAVGRNSYLDKVGRELGLDKYIVGVMVKKTVADTVEAILGAVYEDGGMAKAKEVMDALDLVPRAKIMERKLESEGFVLLEDEDLEVTLPPSKRQRR